MNDRILLSKVLRYIKHYPKDIILVIKFLLILGFTSIAKRRKLTNSEFILLLYKHFLGIAIIDEELLFYTNNLDKGNFSWLQTICSFLMLPIGIEKKLFTKTGMDSHHLARVKLVKETLPKADRILDLGGSCAFCAEGALRVMGYPYQPRRLDIIDLPPEDRIYHLPTTETQQNFITEDGIEINYIYSSMSDLSTILNETIDLVWSGQSIEHVTETEAEKVIQEAFRVLKPGGSFCLDTPNQMLTKLLAREGFVHPEHKIEYAPEQLVAKLKSTGFAIEQQLAVSPMPYSLRTQKFSKLELINSTGLSATVDEGFSFFIACRKPVNSN